MLFRKFSEGKVKTLISLMKHFLRLCHTDGHSTVDIIFKWVPEDTEVSIGNKEMAQFGYKGSKLTSGADDFGAAGKD